jgi:Protein of unknown function (DUF3105)
VAKKDRAPAPPRPVQAPKARSSREPRDPRRTRLLIAAIAGVLLLAAAIAGIAYAMTRGGGDTEAGGVCEITTVEAQSQDHVPPVEIDLEEFEYNTYPPSSGPHNPQPAIYGEYQDPVPTDRYLHSQEHGGITIQYGADVPDDVVQRLVGWFRTDPRGLILAPLPEDDEAEDLQGSIVMTAWVAEREVADDPGSEITKQEGKLAVCSTFDEDTFDDFKDDNVARGPELFSLDDLMPGQG